MNFNSSKFNHILNMWKKLSGGKNVTYNNSVFLMNSNGAGEGVEFYYTFSFTYEFDANVNDEILFAHAIPYTYTDL